MNTYNNATVAEKAAEQLRALGVEVAFGVVGDSISPLVSAMKHGGGPRFIPFRTEGAAALGASAYAKITGQMGVCLADAGPGAAYLINGAYDAFFDSVPLLVLTGQSPTPYLHTRYHQTADQNLMFAGCTRMSATAADPESTLDLLRRAVSLARTQSTATHLSMPKDLQMAGCQAPVRRAPRGMPSLFPAPQMPDPRTVAEMTHRLRESQRPVILFGRSARMFAPQLWELANALPSPLVCSLPAIGVFPDAEPLLMGPLGDAGTPAARQVLQEADTVLTVATSWWPEEYAPEDATVLQIDCQPANLGTEIPADWSLLSDAGVALKEMRDLIPPPTAARRDWSEYAVSVRMQSRTRADASDGDRGGALHPAAVMQVLGQVLPEDAVIALDVGDCALWFGAHFPARRQEVLLSGMWRALGFALPAALAAKLAQPERPVVALAGDAGIAQTLMELTVSMQENLPIVAVILDNQGMAIEAHEQMRMGLEPVAVRRRFELPVAALAQTLGVAGIAVNSTADLAAAVQTAFESGQPTVLQIPVQADAPPEVRRRMAPGARTPVGAQPGRP